jgi:tRNA threonylcarbamoyladenosine modification (KEOPS) complex Cgi121 subunit
MPVLCWAADVPPGSAEDFLARLRRAHPGLLIQLVCARENPSPAAIEMVAAQTIHAKKAGSMLANSPDIDLLLRLAGTSQIGEAFREVGYKRAGPKVLVAAGPGGAVARLQGSLRQDKRLRALKREALTDEDLAVVERAALVAARL